MNRPKCVGCSRPVAAGSHWCPPCHRRLPSQLAEQVAHAERALRAATAAAVVWLEQHPHATQRELEILTLAARGRSNDEIAAELHVSVHTVRDAWRNLCKRWGCRGRAHAIATAFQLGYLEVRTRGGAA